MIYIVVFCLSLLFAFWANQAANRNNHLVMIVSSLCSILLPVLLAGYRDLSIGTDTYNYTIIFSNICYCSDFKECVILYPSIEKGYLFLNYLIALISNDTRVFLTIVHCCIVIPIYVSFFKLRSWLSPVLSLAIFFFVFYNESYNLTRQYISIALMLLATTYYIKHNYLLYVILTIISVSMHNTALLGLFFPAFYYSTKHISVKKHMSLYLLLMVVITYVFLNLQRLGFFATFTSEMSDKYDGYMSGQASVMSVSNSTLIVYLVVFMLLILKLFNNKKHSALLDTFTLMSLLSVIFVNMSSIARALYRLSLDFSIYSSLSISMLFQYKNNVLLERRSYPLLIKVLFVLLLISYWFFSVVIRGSNDTFPYVINI